MEGWVKVHRKLLSKAFYSKDSERVHLWIHLLLKANHTGREEMFNGKPIYCKAGQFTTGRKQLSLETGISESKIQRILTYFEKTEQQIEQQTSPVNRLISICNWTSHQQTEQRSEQRSNNDRTTSEQRPNTLQEGKEGEEGEENKNKKPPYFNLKKESNIDLMYANVLLHKVKITRQEFKYEIDCLISTKIASEDNDKDYADYAAHLMNTVKKKYPKGLVEQKPNWYIAAHGVEKKIYAENKEDAKRKFQNSFGHYSEDDNQYNSIREL